MPYKDPDVRREKARQYGRAYRERNPEKELERYQRYREEHRDERRARYQANAEELRRRQREAYYRDHEKNLELKREAARRARVQNPMKRQGAGRRWKQANQPKIAVRYLKYRHGPHAEADWAAMWHGQGGCCYLCGRPLRERAPGPPVENGAVIDHDHRCCPPEASCTLCRRGLACNRCNKLIGLVGDNPELLQLIAVNLVVAQFAVTDRLAQRPQQDELAFDRPLAHAAVANLPALGRLRPVSEAPPGGVAAP